MPGIRSAEMVNKDWPRTHHDKLATGFSPLVCGMKKAPVQWASITLPGRLDWLRVLSTPGQDEKLLVSDSHLRLFTADGKELWSRSACGKLWFYGELHGDGRLCLLMGAGRRLVELDTATGSTIWSHEFEPSYVDLVVRVADMLRNQPGLEAAVFLVHGDEGSLLRFPPNATPEFAWRRPVVTPGEFDERYDHGNGIEIDLSQPDAPVIWNLRRFRCRGINARTGEVTSTLEYKIGGEQRRNYGEWALGMASGGGRLAIVLADNVQLHAHAIRLNPTGQNELAWQHYYGEVYRDAPGVALAKLAIDDLDGDSVTEVAYSVRDPAQEFRSFVRVRNGETGEIKFDLADHWAAAVLRSDLPNPSTLLLVYAAPKGTTPTQGDLEAFITTGSWPARKVASLTNASFLQPEVGRPQNDTFYVRETDATGNAAVRRYHWTASGIAFEQEMTGELFRSFSLRAILRNSNGSEVFVLASNDGELILANADSSRVATIPLHGASSPTLSAADLDADGRAELLAALPQGRLRVYSFSDDGQAALRAEYPYAKQWFEQGPVSYDLLGDGSREIMSTGRAPDGRFTVAAQRLGRKPIWETSLGLFADEVRGCIFNAGQFLGADHAAVAVSVSDERLVHEGTYLLNGHNGAVRWFKSRYRDGAVVMPYRPRGVPTAVDIDGDGAEDIGMDMLSYMSYLRGADGEFAFLRHTQNISPDNATYAGHLYNTFCPIYDSHSAKKPYWFVIGGFGPFGLMKPDPTEGMWRVDLGYDVPPKIGMVDVDGDGQMEVGYAASYDSKFVCRDLWTGKVEWELRLPSPPNSPTYSADVDGDGKGEFLTSCFCIGTDDQGKGELRWQAPSAMGWGAIADFDGDGKGEIACPSSGGVSILHSDRSAVQNQLNTTDGGANGRAAQR